MKQLLAIFFIFISVNLKLNAQSDSQQMADEKIINLPINENLIFQIPEEIPKFQNPPANYKLKGDYSKIDKSHLISSILLNKALVYFEYNFELLRNKKFLTLVDFSQHSSKRRLYLVDMNSGDVFPMLVAAGQGSDPDGDGWATEFSNIQNSHMSSIGFYLTAEEYLGANGRSLRLHGLSTTNSQAFERFIVVHGANYVLEEESFAGRSHGCPAVDHKNINFVIDRIREGSLLFITN